MVFPTIRTGDGVIGEIEVVDKEKEERLARKMAERREITIYSQA